MTDAKESWEEMHHRSYFLPKLEQIECDEFRTTFRENVGHPMIPLGTHGIYAKGKMENLSPTIPINISWIIGKVENVYIGVDCSPDEIKIYTKLFK